MGPSAYPRGIRHKLTLAVCAWSCVAFCPPAAASPLRSGLDLTTMLATADFAFQGRVIDVAYRNAEPRAEAELAPPYTFVTYEVSRVFKGRDAPATITLRFRGGPIDENRFLTSPDTPLFDAGDEDILLVQGNTLGPCPLVDCQYGRFRLIEGKVYNELGQSVEWTPNKMLAIGPAFPLEQVLQHRMSATIQLSIEDSELDPHHRPEREMHAGAEDFATYVADTVRTSLSPEALAAVPPVVSADITQPFADDVAPLGAAAQPVQAAVPVVPAATAASAPPLARSLNAVPVFPPARVAAPDIPATRAPRGAPVWIVLLLGLALAGVGLWVRKRVARPARTRDRNHASVADTTSKRSPKRLPRSV